MNQTQRKGVSPETNAVYVEKLSRMVACKTVWRYDGENDSQFQRFYQVI